MEEKGYDEFALGLGVVLRKGEEDYIGFPFFPGVVEDDPAESFAGGDVLTVKE